MVSLRCEPMSGCCHSSLWFCCVTLASVTVRGCFGKEVSVLRSETGGAAQGKDARLTSGKVTGLTASTGKQTHTQHGLGDACLPSLGGPVQGQPSSTSCIQGQFSTTSWVHSQTGQHNETWDWSLETKSPVMVAHGIFPSTWEAGVELSWIQSKSGMYSEFQAAWAREWNLVERIKQN